MSSDGTWTTLVSLDSADASYGVSLVQGTDGNLYGTAAGSDLSVDNGYGPGAIFRIVMPPLPPRLRLARNGNRLVLSWPTNAAGFALQTSPDLTNWNNSTASPVIMGAQYAITNDISGSSQFYRLKK